MDTQTKRRPVSGTNRLAKYVDKNQRRPDKSQSPMFGALTMTRRVGESFRIDDAVVTCIRLRGKQAMLRIVAPKTTKISRSELPARESHPDLNHDLLEAVISLRQEQQCPTGSLDQITDRIDSLIAELV